MKVERILSITDERLVETLWSFYHTIFLELNSRTPLSQTLDKPRFRSWLKSSRAIKFVVRDENTIHALAVVSSDLRHDPLISIPYWEKTHPGKKIFHFPVIAISETLRESHGSTCLEIMQGMMGEIPPDAVALFFHSEKANPAMPRLVRLACRNKVEIASVDSMSCALCTWKSAGS